MIPLYIYALFFFEIDLILYVSLLHSKDVTFTPVNKKKRRCNITNNGFLLECVYKMNMHGIFSN
jgi:hypothetical protein